MNTTALLHQMCKEDLMKADINAIGKNRGFARREFANRAALESIFLSPVGVERAMATLTSAEAALLHLLHTVDKAVSLEWFERLYNPDFKSSYYSRTFTQRYQDVFKKTRVQLVRKGVLIMAQTRISDATKMEKWRFIFPQEFAPYLPSPMGESKQLTTPGNVRRDVARDKLLALVDKASVSSHHLLDYALSLSDGRLLIGERPFKAAGLRDWQRAGWHIAMPDGSKLGAWRAYNKGDKFEATSVEAFNYGLGLLGADEWIAPQQLDDLLKIFTLRSFDTQKVCELGWKWGYLAKNEADGRAYYRLAGEEADGERPPAPTTYLFALDEKTAQVDLQTIPYAALEQLNQIAYLGIKNGEMTAVVHLTRMGVAPQDILDSPPAAWLTKNVPAFVQAQKTIRVRWGKQIVHTNLHIARVKDLSLRVKLERTLKAHEYILLSDDYIAFPPKALAKVTRIVAQAGHVVKKAEGK